MIINMNDPASIRQWLRVNPERHRKLLRGIWRLRPQYREAIEQAVNEEEQQRHQHQGAAHG